MVVTRRIPSEVNGVAMDCTVKVQKIKNSFAIEFFLGQRPPVPNAAFLYVVRARMQD